MAYDIKKIAPEEIAGQLDICARLHARFMGEGRAMLAFVDTYGCQQNESDSERIRGYLAEMGFSFTRDEYEADIIVINTCAVRGHAEQRILGNVGALSHTKRQKREQIICLCGCMVQQKHMAEKIKKSYPIVNVVFGPHELWRFPELLELYVTRKKRVFEVSESDGSLAEGEPRRRDSSLKGWISVMYGCNNFCTYCVVPYVRGRERSRLPEDIIAEARALVEGGCRDITLLGQNVNSYGRDLGLGTDFADLIRMVNDIPGKFVIRFMTSHPKDANERLFRAMAECEKCARHLHLPVQCGSDRVLRAMNRGYDRDSYLAKVRRARELIPGLVVTTDIIVGFPGETDEDFEDTLSLVEEVRYDAMFTFIFSPRVGTKAASMPDPMSREDKQKNFDRLVEAANRISLEKHGEYVGKTVEVLVDGVSAGEEYPLTSRTASGRLVHLKGGAELVGHYLNVKITDSATWALFGQIQEGR